MPRMVVLNTVWLKEISSYSKLKKLKIIFVQRIWFFVLVYTMTLFHSYNKSQIDALFLKFI
jgi:hypothetical protein